MQTELLFPARIGFMLLTLVCLALVLAGLRYTFRKMHLPPPKNTRRILLVAAILIGWLVLVSFLALKGVLSDFSVFPPKLMLVIVPPLVGILVITFHSRFRNFLLHLPLPGLLYLQFFRVPVELLLWWLFTVNAIPEQMTFEGRNFDIVAGLTAPLFGWLCYGKGRQNHSLAIFWNLLGLGLLLNIVVTAILSLPTPIRVFMNEPSSWRVATFPIAFLPAALVPLAYTLHFFSLRRIWLERRIITKSA